MSTQLVQDALGLFSGSFVGFSLGLVGGGGSILAVPLMIYLVGVPSVHIAIGTSALAVAVNAAANLLSHAHYVVLSLPNFRLVRSRSLSLGAWVPKNLARRTLGFGGALPARPARAAWAVQRLLAARW